MRSNEEMIKAVSEKKETVWINPWCLPVEATGGLIESPLLISERCRKSKASSSMKATC